MSIHIRKFLQIAAVFSVMGFAISCGGGGSSTSSTTSSSSGTTNNVAPLLVDSGPAGVDDEDLAFTSVVVCVPGTSTCQTIDHVEVDTGSEGLRILAPILTVGLTQQTANGNGVMECSQFADLTYVWGPVATADIQIAGEVAKSVPVQVISNQAAPFGCSSGNSSQITNVSTLGANAILGVGPFRQDCGGACALPIASGNPDFYYNCNSAACAPISESLTAQLQNPVWMFSADNNGVILQLPSVSGGGQSNATGSLIFGIGTESNNGLGNAVVLPVDPNTGNFAAQFMGTTYNDANFIDSGSNGYFFLDSSTLINTFGIPIPDCSSSGVAVGFYCPGSTVPISVAVIGNTASGTFSGASRTINFNVANAESLFGNSSLTVFNNVGGDNTGSFDFGLPFFFGRSVYTAIENQSTPAGTGPYFAF